MRMLTRAGVLQRLRPGVYWLEGNLIFYDVYLKKFRKRIPATRSPTRRPRNQRAIADLYIERLAYANRQFHLSAANVSLLDLTTGPRFQVFADTLEDFTLKPFITGGYTLGFRGGSENLYNLGGGIDYWPKQHVGLRFDVRDHVLPSACCDATAHFLVFRVSLLGR